MVQLFMAKIWLLKILSRYVIKASLVHRDNAWQFVTHLKVSGLISFVFNAGYDETHRKRKTK